MGERKESLEDLYELCDNSSYNCSSYAVSTVYLAHLFYIGQLLDLTLKYIWEKKLGAKLVKRVAAVRSFPDYLAFEPALSLISIAAFVSMIFRNSKGATILASGALAMNKFHSGFIIS